jgi:lipoteichoic acid synthase
MTSMSLRIGPLLVCLCVAAYRAFWLSHQLSGIDAPEVGYLLLADLPVIGALGILAFMEAVCPRAWKLVPVTLTVLLFAVYLADVAAVVSLNARLQLSDIRQFAPEWWVVRSFVSVSSVAILLLVTSSLFVTWTVTRVAARALPVGALVLALVPVVVNEQSIPAHLQKYTGSVVLLGKELWGSRRMPVSRYRESDVEAYRSEYDALFDAPIARARRDIVLVIVESLSAVDSHRTSGLRNVLPRFDALSRKGRLFRNFAANFEASEGGIVALVSGVPPLHFPSATTDTFGEYATQRSITATFRRSGYHTEFLTSVPLQFISMDTYARSPLGGFAVAAGQHEIGRFKGAPRYAFQSPADHLLYEELLARWDARPHGQPAFMVVVTASSHPPYVDPLHRGNTEENAWAYVQEELWWLHEQLESRGFFANGLLLITGDHRKMLPVQQAEREHFGASAKARIPLLVIGAGVPVDTVDDRLFQQADLLRMLDRAVQPGGELSPFVVWVERYVFVFGVASNASHVEVFDASNGARQTFRIRLRGAEIEWLDRPPNALAVERAVHRQRALQQFARGSTASDVSLSFGRELKPSDHQKGILVGFAKGSDPSRDPDDPRAGLKVVTTESLDLDKVLPLAGEGVEPLTLTARAFLTIPVDGEYWFSVFASGVSCLAIEKDVVLGCRAGLNQGAALLAAGTHRFDLRFVVPNRRAIFTLEWLPPGETRFTDFPQGALILPEVATDRR